MASAFRASRQPPLSKNPAYAPENGQLLIKSNSIGRYERHVVGSAKFDTLVDESRARYKKN